MRSGQEGLEQQGDRYRAFVTGEQVLGNDGANTLTGVPGDDFLNGKAGDDMIRGMPGVEALARREGGALPARAPCPEPGDGLLPVALAEPAFALQYAKKQ